MVGLLVAISALTLVGNGSAEESLTLDYAVKVAVHVSNTVSVSGWVMNPERPEEPVNLTICLGSPDRADTVKLKLTADQETGNAGIGNHGFNLTVNESRANMIIPKSEPYPLVILADMGGNTVTLDSSRFDFSYTRFTDWSGWYTPKADTVNSCFTFGTMYLFGLKQGDRYRCRLEVEFNGISVTEGQAFRCFTQGAVDRTWGQHANIWTSNIIYFETPPADGVYQFEGEGTIVENNVDSTVFDCGIRCDYWHTGQFRIRFLEVEKIPEE